MTYFLHGHYPHFLSTKEHPVQSSQQNENHDATVLLKLFFSF